MKKIINHITKSFANISVFSKFISIFIITILIPIMVINFFSHFYSSKLVQNQIENSLYNLTEQIDENIGELFSNMDNITSLLYTSEIFNSILKSNDFKNDIDLLYANREFDKLFLYILNQQADIESIYVFTNTKQIFYKSYSGSLKLDYAPENESWYSEVINNQGSTVFFEEHSPWPISNSKTKVFSLAREIKNYNGESLGVILIDIKPNSMSNIIENTVGIYSSKFFILNDATVIFNNFDLSNDDIEILNEFIKLQKSPSNETINNEHMLLVYRKSSYLDWHIISVTPFKYINQYNNKLLIFSIIIGSITLLVCSLLIYLLYISIYKPLKQLALSMSKVGTININSDIDYTSKDEISLLFLGFNKLITKIKNLVDSEYKAKIMQKDAEFKALQAQINPHFLYNTLQLISSIAVINQVSEIHEASKALGIMLRYGIQSQDNFVPIEKEISHVQSYLSIQKIRMGEKLSAEINYDQEVLDFGIVKLVIQPFVENSFIHGLENKKGLAKSEISIRVQKKNLIIKISDNGVGIEEHKLQLLKSSLKDGHDHPILGSEESIGFHNVNSRLSLFYGQKYKLDIESHLNIGTDIIITIPAIKNKTGDNNV